jgi:hypothetical protein
MSMNCPLRGPATGARLEKLGQPEIKQVKADLIKLRASVKQIAKDTGNTIGAMNKQQYKRAVRHQFFARLRAEKSRRAKKYQQNKLHSLNAEKAARVQAIREAWARTQAT